MTAAARRIQRQGFMHRDLGPAFSAEVEQTEEELSAEKQAGLPLVERLLKTAAVTFASGAGMSLIGVMAWEVRWRSSWALMMGITWAGATLTGLTYLAVAQRTKDIDTKFWSRLWMGPMGKAAFRLASRFKGAETHVGAMTHRATELSLGIAAEQLFDSLPRETRKQLADIPVLLTKLQAAAQTLRRQRDELQDAVGMSTAPDVELVAMRDRVQTKLGEAVGALETLRLDLLRLHAGSTNMQSVTTHIGIASDVSDQIERLIAANREIDSVLEFPRLAASTPA
jgi:serine/threonine-protein kinase